MAKKGNSSSLHTAELSAACSRLLAALDEVLTDSPKRRKTSPSGGRPAIPPPLKVQLAMARLVAGVKPEMTYTWKQLLAMARSSEDTLGMALSKLIPRTLKTRHEGVERIYFLAGASRKMKRHNLRRAGRRKAA
jgi:hypothetical protein